MKIRTISAGGKAVTIVRLRRSEKAKLNIAAHFLDFIGANDKELDYSDLGNKEKLRLFRVTI